MRNKPKAPPNRKAPRRLNTGRDSDLLTLEKIIIHARPVKSGQGARHINEIIPAVMAEIGRRTKR